MKHFILCLLMTSSLGITAQVRIVQKNVKNTALHTVYIGIQNEFTIDIPSDSRLIEISSSIGEVKMMPENTLQLFVNDLNPAGVQFKYTLGKNGQEQGKITDPIHYQIRRVPDVFHFKIGSKTQSGKIKRSEINPNMFIGLDEQNCNIILPIQKFQLTMLHIAPSSYKIDPIEIQIDLKQSNAIDMLHKILKDVKPNSKIFFEDISVTLENGVSRKLDPLSLQVE
jgi:hypothetical protein